MILYKRKSIELSKKYNIIEVAYDRWGAVQMSQNLEGENFTMVPFGQGYREMSPASKELYRLVLDEKLRHGGHPVLRWMFENVYIETDAAANIKPSKKKSNEKIDGAVAAIMALDRAVKQEKKPHGSILVYDYDTNTAYRNGELVSTSEKRETAEEKRRRIERETLFGDDW